MRKKWWAAGDARVSSGVLAMATSFGHATSLGVRRWTCVTPPVNLTDESGMVLWLWFEVVIGLSLVVIVLGGYLAGRGVSGPGASAVVLGGAFGCACGLGLAVLGLARAAHSYRSTAGWVDVDDGGWEALRREAAAEKCGGAFGLGGGDDD